MAIIDKKYNDNGARVHKCLSYVCTFTQTCILLRLLTLLYLFYEREYIECRQFKDIVCNHFISGCSSKQRPENILRISCHVKKIV